MPYASCLLEITLRNMIVTNRLKHFSLWVDCHSLWSISYFFLTGLEKKSVSFLICVDVERKEENTFLTSFFLILLKSLKWDPASNRALYFFSYTRIKVNYISLLTGMWWREKMKCFQVLQFFIYLLRRNPFRKSYSTAKCQAAIANAICS